MLSEVTLVKKSAEHPTRDLTDIVSTVTSRYIQRIALGFVEPATDARLQSAIESKAWKEFDEAITRLADQALNNGRRLQLELHVCGNPSVELFNSMLPLFAENESGCLKVVKTSYIGKGSIPHPLPWSK